MTADDFERAVLAEPAADMPRLVYADWLDETGDPGNAARAEYIRLQCEAARLSDLDHRRHLLDQRASHLFRVHWIDWWRPVCRRLKLPEPETDIESLASRFPHTSPSERTAGWPYLRIETPDSDTVTRYYAHDLTGPVRAFAAARFGRGFVDDIDISSPSDWAGRPSVADCLAAVPAAGLTLGASVASYLTSAGPVLRHLGGFP